MNANRLGKVHRMLPLPPRARPIISSRFVYPEVNIVDLIQRNRKPHTYYISEQCLAFSEEAMKARKKPAQPAPQPHPGDEAAIRSKYDLEV